MQGKIFFHYECIIEEHIVHAADDVFFLKGEIVV